MDIHCIYFRRVTGLLLQAFTNHSIDMKLRCVVVRTPAKISLDLPLKDLAYVTFVITQFKII